MDVILTVKDFLIVRFALVKSTEEILFLGNLVYNVLSVDEFNDVVKTLRSVTLSEVSGNFPSAIPETVDTPETVKLLVFTDKTFAYTGSDKEVSLYEIISSFFILFPGKDKSGLVIVLIPADSGEIKHIPMEDFVD